MCIASHCRPDSPLPCLGRKRAGQIGPGVWYSPEARVWFAASDYGIFACTHCPYCGMPLPMMGSGADILRLLRDALQERPDGD